MKKNKLKSLLTSLFALSLVFGAGAFASSTKVAEPASAIVLLEEETPETTPEEETSKDSSSEESESKPAEESSSSEGQIETVPATPKNIFAAIGKTFRDAWLDLLAHIKKWFKK